jgi:hypothetical protein
MIAEEEMPKRDMFEKEEKATLGFGFSVAGNDISPENYRFAELQRRYEAEFCCPPRSRFRRWALRLIGGRNVGR